MTGCNTGNSIAVSAQSDALRESSSFMDELGWALAQLGSLVSGAGLVSLGIDGVLINDDDVVKCCYCGKSEFKPGLYGFTVCCSCGASQEEMQLSNDSLCLEPVKYTPPPMIFKWQRFPMQLVDINYDASLAELLITLRVEYPPFFARKVTIPCGERLAWKSFADWRNG